MSRLYFRILVAMAGLVAAIPARALAVDKTYIGGGGSFNWSDGTKWAAPGQPNVGDNVFAIPADPVNRTIVYDASALAVQFGTVTLSSGGTGIMSVVNNGATFRANGLTLGPNASLANFLNGESFINSITMTGGTLGNGTFHVANLTQNSGLVSSTTVEVSNRYVLQGGLMVSTVRSNGTCDFVGGVTGAGTIYNYGTFNYNSSAGSLQVSIANYGAMNFLTPATIGRLDTFVSTSTSSSLPLNVLAISVHAGTFTQLANITSYADIAIGPGTWDQRGGALVLNGPNTRSLAIGSNNGVNVPLDGKYLLSGGTITCDLLAVGSDFSRGTMTQTGGQVSSTVTNVGANFGGSGTYSISAGTLGTGSINVGGGNGVSGVFTQSGGYVLTNALTINENSASFGSASFSGGSLQTGRVINNGPLIQTGGKITASIETLGAGSLTVSGTGSLTTGTLRQNSVHIGNGGRVLTSQGSASTSRAYSLVIDEISNNAVGRWDLGRGALVDDYTGASPVAAVRRYLKSGYAAGNWNGTGLISSAGNTANPRNSALGYTESSNLFGASGGVFAGILVDSSAVLVKYTWYGDTDLNGVVNFDDYARTDNGFNNGGTDWFHGDFNYDNVVNFDDYALIDRAFNTQSGVLRQAASSLWNVGRDDFQSASAANFLNAVPEPSAGILLVTSLALLRRRISR
ncbi:hypothetical protein BH09PLA1_BH09PLA1_03200 [soil metagenome]